MTISVELTFDQLVKAIEKLSLEETEQLVQIIERHWREVGGRELKCSVLGEKYPQITPRDWLHLAVMLNNGITEIISADSHFDDIEGVTRLDPREFVQGQP